MRSEYRPRDQHCTGSKHRKDIKYRNNKCNGKCIFDSKQKQTCHKFRKRDPEDQTIRDNAFSHRPCHIIFPSRNARWYSAGICRFKNALICGNSSSINTVAITVIRSFIKNPGIPAAIPDTPSITPSEMPDISLPAFFIVCADSAPTSCNPCVFQSALPDKTQLTNVPPTDKNAA